MRDRMCKCLKAGCEKEAGSIFSNAANLLSSHLAALFEDVSKECGQILQALVKELEAQLSVLWERLSKVF
jgi:hypothetical protein